MRLSDCFQSRCSSDELMTVLGTILLVEGCDYTCSETHCQVHDFIQNFLKAMNAENRPLVTDEPVEFEKYPVEVQDFREITHHLRGIYRIFLVKNNGKITTCNRLDLETLGF